MAFLLSFSCRVRVVQVVASVLVLVFSYTALSKFMAIGVFEEQMLNQPLPRGLKRVLVWVLPTVELIISGMLVMKRTRYFGLLAGTLLMGVFTVYVGAVTFHFFDRVPCSCGGVLSGMGWTAHLIFNGVLLLVAVVGCGVALSLQAAHQRILNE